MFFYDNPLIKQLEDTLERCSTLGAEYHSARVYFPEELEALCLESDAGARCSYSVSHDDSFSAALRLAAETHAPQEVLVLNFANAISPGGGVRLGARAQEEDLCRKSSLLLSLEGEEAAPYYKYNKQHHPNLGTDAIIISQKVKIIKDAGGNPLNEGVTVAVMTCAAPCIIGGLQGLTQEEYEALLYRRITHMLTLAAHLSYKVLVLGAWGCGAFRNDAALVAGLFRKAFKELCRHGENEQFSRVEFAVFSRNTSDYNFRQFSACFADFYGDEKKSARNAVQEKIRGCLLGGAAGDALGYAVEFEKTEIILHRYGKDGITSYDIDDFTGKALISDDTQMTLFTANAILTADTAHQLRGSTEGYAAFAARAYLDWLFTQEHRFEERDEHSGVSWLMNVPELFHRRAPGNTCLTALRNLEEMPQLPTDFIASKRNHSKGCGGVMRVAPVGCFSKLNAGEAATEAAQIAAVTHCHSLGYLPAAVLAFIVHKAIFESEGTTLKAIAQEAADCLEKQFSEDSSLYTMCDVLHTAISLAENDATDEENLSVLGGGWVGEEALAIGVYCALRYQDNFDKALAVAVNHDGDSDSTGAVAGNILGAWLGATEIGEKWKTDLELADVIEELADDLFRTCQKDENDRTWLGKYIDAHRA